MSAVSARWSSFRSVKEYMSSINGVTVLSRNDQFMTTNSRYLEHHYGRPWNETVVSIISTSPPPHHIFEEIHTIEDC